MAELDNHDNAPSRGAEDPYATETDPDAMKTDSDASTVTDATSSEGLPITDATDVGNQETAENLMRLFSNFHTLCEGLRGLPGLNDNGGSEARHYSVQQRVATPKGGPKTTQCICKHKGKRHTISRKAYGHLPRKEKDVSMAQKTLELVSRHRTLCQSPPCWQVGDNSQPESAIVARRLLNPAGEHNITLGIRQPRDLRPITENTTLVLNADLVRWEDVYHWVASVGDAAIRFLSRIRLVGFFKVDLGESSRGLNFLIYFHSGQYRVAAEGQDYDELQAECCDMTRVARQLRVLAKYVISMNKTSEPVLTAVGIMRIFGIFDIHAARTLPGAAGCR